MYPKLYKRFERVLHGLGNCPIRAVRAATYQVHLARLKRNPNYPMELLLDTHLYALEHPEHDPEYVKWWVEKDLNL